MDALLVGLVTTVFFFAIFCIDEYFTRNLIKRLEQQLQDSYEYADDFMTEIDTKTHQIDALTETLRALGYEVVFKKTTIGTEVHVTNINKKTTCKKKTK